MVAARRRAIHVDSGGSRDAARRLAAARSSGMQPGGSQLPGAGGGAQPSPGGLPGSSHDVAGSAAAMGTPQPSADAKRR
jgi:hypothetical protein